MNWLCEACIHYPPSSADGKPCVQCNPEGTFDCCFQSKEIVVYVPSKEPRTNADLIRAMTDEDMAFEMTAKGGCPHYCETPDDIDTDCVKCWLDWLKQEVEK